MTQSTCCRLCSFVACPKRCDKVAYKEFRGYNFIPTTTCRICEKIDCVLFTPIDGKFWMVKRFG